MSRTERLDELMHRWEVARAAGRSLTADVLCADAPDLADDLRRRIRAVEAMEGVLGVRPHDPRKTLPAPDLVPPATERLPDVPGYRLIRVVGEGGMGIVYEAVQLDLGRTVALKMLSGPRLSPKHIARFRTEAEAAARLQHPNVLQIFEVGEASGRPFYSMELVVGETLAECLDRATPSPSEAAEFVETLARAAEAAHGRGVVHRDLKPANVLLAADGTPKIADFGLAKRLDDDTGHTQTGEILGTPAYMAPEQAEGEAIGPWTDVYALGAILYEMLTRRPPFEGASAMDTLRLVTSRDPVAPSKLVPGLPRDLEAICLKCLEKEPGRRYASAAALADDLGRFLAGRPTVARPVGAFGTAWKWVRRHPLETAVAGLVVVLAAIPLVGWLAEVQEDRRLRQRAVEQAGLAWEILHRNCVECHDHAGPAKEDFDILDHDVLVAPGRDFVVPGRLYKSRLLRRIADGSMPPEKFERERPRLAEAELAVLREWIAGGAPPFPPEGDRPTPPVVTYPPLAVAVRGIFVKRCYECHKYDVEEGGIKILHHRLLVHESRVVIPGRPEESELFQLLTHPKAERRMPPNDQLPADEIATIRRWISEGAPPF